MDYASERLKHLDKARDFARDSFVRDLQAEDAPPPAEEPVTHESMESPAVEAEEELAVGDEAPAEAGYVCEKCGHDSRKAKEEPADAEMADDDIAALAALG